MCSSVFLEETHAFCTPALIFSCFLWFLVLQRLPLEHYMQPWDERYALVMAVSRSLSLHMIKDGSFCCFPHQLNAQLTSFCLLFLMYFLAAPICTHCYMWLVNRAFRSHLKILKSHSFQVIGCWCNKELYTLHQLSVCKSIYRVHFGNQMPLCPSKG